jgi:hypothetical protein
MSTISGCHEGGNPAPNRPTIHGQPRRISGVTFGGSEKRPSDEHRTQQMRVECHVVAYRMRFSPIHADF